MVSLAQRLKHIGGPDKRKQTFPPLCDKISVMSQTSSQLTVESILSELNLALASSRTVVLQAPPGSGKTTRVPLALLDSPWLTGRRILMLEPRRLAATNAARYMAALRHEDIGGTVGYAIRYDRRVGPTTRLEVITEGLLTRRLQNDAELSGVGLVIFDEFHERSLQADLALGGYALALVTLVRNTISNLNRLT